MAIKNTSKTPGARRSAEIRQQSAVFNWIAKRKEAEAVGDTVTAERCRAKSRAIIQNMMGNK
tara:strand:- start:5358 stop:5543 length:186 start_codon:yes stop_codon:yes gene_type:complete